MAKKKTRPAKVANYSATTHVKNMMMSATELTTVFVGWLILHMGIMYLANQWFPQSVVLGNHILSSTQALLYSMLVFTLITVGFVPLIENVVQQFKWKLSNFHWLLLYLVINSLVLWGIARMAEILGLGLASWMVVLSLAVVLDLVQGFLVMLVSRQPFRDV